MIIAAIRSDATQADLRRSSPGCGLRAVLLAAWLMTMACQGWAAEQGVPESAIS